MRVSKYLFHKFIKDNGIKIQKEKSVEKLFAYFTKWLNQEVFRKKRLTRRVASKPHKETGIITTDIRYAEKSPKTVSFHIFRIWVKKELQRLQAA